MKNSPKHIRKTGSLLNASYGLLLLGSLLFCGSVFAEKVAAEESLVKESELNGSATSVLLQAEELEELVAPIALYPDDLLGVVLPASTYPLQIVQASRYLAARKKETDPASPDGEWDDSIVALMNYPEVLDLLNNDLNWTWKLGEAVLGQHEDVIIAIAEFRKLARTAGNLDSDKHQTVEVLDGGAIEIKPANPEVIYVPYYEPSQVVVYSPRPVYHYYPHAYPVYYYPYPAGYTFTSAFFWGVTSAFSIGWNTHHLHVHHFGYDGHPYSGHQYQYSYNHHYYRRPVVSVTYTQNFNNHYKRNRHQHHAGNYWQPKHIRAGARPRYRDAGLTYTGNRLTTRTTNHRDDLKSARKSRQQTHVAQPQRRNEPVRKIQRERKDRKDIRLARIEKETRRDAKRTERLNASLTVQKSNLQQPRVRREIPQRFAPSAVSGQSRASRAVQNRSIPKSPKAQPRKVQRSQVASSNTKPSKAPVHKSSRATKKRAVANKPSRRRGVKREEL